MSLRDREARPLGESAAETEEAGPATPLDRALLDWRSAQERVTAYLSALGFEAAEVGRLCRQALERALALGSHDSAVLDAMEEVPRVLLETHPLPSAGPAAHGGEAFLRWRLSARGAGRVPRAGMPEPVPLTPTPPLLRGVMTSERFLGRRLGEWRRRGRPAVSAEPADPPREERRLARVAWGRRGRWRRALLAILVVVPSALAGAAFLATLPAQVWLPAELALALIFGALFGWISLGFWTALFGFVTLLRGGDRFAITRGEKLPAPPLDSASRTAVVMPVCDEPVARVFAGLRATHESLVRTGAVEAFDFFILSDSVDPDICADEVAAWADWRRDAAGGGGIFYRRRRVRQKRKSGNVADFCRRFGRRYRYMVVLDADSVMSGETLARLAQLMEAHPHVGVIQTAPRVVRARSLFARVQQFASRLYGPMFAAGMHYWQLGDSPYWGHNAIIRVEPFMKHCALPRLSGNPPFGGDILSHDFVEAALLGRAGWSIWLAFDLPGSWEETPGSLLEEMQRDKRWCQGNLQHLRLLFTEGLSSAHRALFLNGIFSYVSAVLWLGFLVASTGEAVMWAFRGPDYFAAGRTLFPTWPVWRPERARALFAVVVGVLFLPKFLAVGLALRRGGSAAYGGAPALLRGVLFESLSSALFAPIHMAFYCRFVLLNLLGRAVGWSGGADDVHETTWRQAWRRHGPDTAVACAWAAGVYWLHPTAFWWLAPVAGALVFSVPLSVLASRIWLGDRARATGWCVTPEESAPPREIRELEAELGARDAEGRASRSGFLGAVVDPLRNAIQLSLRRGPKSFAPKLREARRQLLERALAGGPEALSDREKRVVLSDASMLAELHARVWSLEEREAVVRWGLAGAVRPQPAEAGPA
jgi:membrane glycosyltransferase